MKNIMIKLLVVVLGVSLYFNVSSILDNQRLEADIDKLNETITALENQEVSEDSCNKLREITIVVNVEKEDFSQSYTHCTNKVYLGDALDEIIEELEVVYNPNYSKDYVYGRMIHSFYGFSKVYEEYYEITINGERSSHGIDFVEIEDDTSYEFTLVRWA